MEVGAELPTIEQKLELANAIMYAGASGDFNPLHWDPEFAAAVSPTGAVIGHGMLAMGLASRLLTSWAGGPEFVREVHVRFTKPWPLGDTATFHGKVTSVDGGEAEVELWALRSDGVRILAGRGRVTLP